MTMLLMLMACVATWALIGTMLGDARSVLGAALRGEPDQAGGWMPSVLPPAAGRSAAASRAFTRA